MGSMSLNGRFFFKSRSKQPACGRPKTGARTISIPASIDQEVARHLATSQGMLGATYRLGTWASDGRPP
jgi:hypothetical protein